MLEIFFVYMLCKKVGEILRRKGRNPIGYQVMAVLFWFGGEVVGAVVGVIAIAVTSEGGGEGGLNLFVYLFALAGAVLGAVVSLIIASAMPRAGG